MLVLLSMTAYGPTIVSAPIFTPGPITAPGPTSAVESISARLSITALGWIWPAIALPLHFHRREFNFGGKFIVDVCSGLHPP